MDFKRFFESSETVTLYRGDPSKYKVHSLSKGDTGALFGQGIYLTNNKRIAGDYTVKGDSDVIFRCGGCRTRQSVLDAFIRVKAQQIDENGKETYFPISLPPMIDDPVRIKRLEYAKKYWEGIRKDYEIRVNVDGNSVIRKKYGGHVSVYELPLDLINSVYNTEEEINEEVLAALCNSMRGAAKGCRELYGFSSQDENGFRPTFREVWRFLLESGWASDKEFQTNFRKQMKALGYKGLFYSGGVTMGGGVRHKAYVFWDEQGLSKHRKT